MGIKIDVIQSYRKDGESMEGKQDIAWVYVCTRCVAVEEICSEPTAMGCWVHLRTKGCITAATGKLK